MDCNRFFDSNNDSINNLRHTFMPCEAKLAESAVIEAYQIIEKKNTFCFSSSFRASERTLAQGRSCGHQGGRVESFPQPGLPRPVEYFNIKVCCLFLIEGLVSNVCGRLRFFAVAIAAAAAIPTGPKEKKLFEIILSKTKNKIY
ncbi:hypothetical protein DERP_000614 [Dermatophagoides pteronyssinus]|uniref:Uncharacterized protein n=1 Tax=Dermatophagoides pteronyssinus TaxID=6956 RepID=A0ABQ8J0S3_DERPT|nr:hypothetical protein DERP_000614 [Dermatophagoides pteronyssinus]